MCIRDRLTFAACSGSSSEASDSGSDEVNVQSGADEAADTGDGDVAGDTDSAAGDGDLATAAGWVLPDWYVCDTDTLFASSMPVSVIGANTTDDEDLGGIYAAETFRFGLDGDNARCEIFYGADTEQLQKGSLDVSALVGPPATVSRLFENSLLGTSEATSEMIGTVEVLVADQTFGTAIYFEVDGAAVIVSVTAFEPEPGPLALELGELVVQAANS